MKLWDQRDLAKLSALSESPGSANVGTVQFYVGLAYHALNDKRKAVQCWREAIRLKPRYEAPIRALAFEFVEQNAAEAADLLSQLDGMGKADADDLTTLAEIRIKQDRLREAHRLLERALELEPNNSLSLLAMASVYAQLRDRILTLSYLNKAAATKDIDLTDLQWDPEYEFLWNDSEFTDLVAPVPPPPDSKETSDFKFKGKRRILSLKPENEK
ncbi:MAG: tetratricopeptide repeat protein [Planctomycetes bacterium]|nr:tetratricopeptide repeat protein [Planctomycetota bacterium]